MVTEKVLDQSAARARRLLGQPAARELVPSTPGRSARWHTHDYPGPYCRWHHHPELEVHLIQHGTGRAIVGDHVGRFGPGYLALVGSDLPHHWISDLPDGERIVERDVVFQFHPDWFRDCERLMPELGSVRGLLERSARGIAFTGGTAEAATTELLAIGTSTGVPRLQHVLTLLHVLDTAPASEAALLASPWTPPPDGGESADLVDRALAYIVARGESQIRLADVARQVGLSASGFSRHFSRASGQSFTETVRKLRLTQACHLLETTDLPVAVVCHRVGYRNLSNFNRQFRDEHDRTPTEHRQRHRDAVRD